jgi:hypothetical protein
LSRDIRHLGPANRAPPRDPARRFMKYPFSVKCAIGDVNRARHESSGAICSYARTRHPCSSLRQCGRGLSAAECPRVAPASNPDADTFNVVAACQPRSVRDRRGADRRPPAFNVAAACQPRSDEALQVRAVLIGPSMWPRLVSRGVFDIVHHRIILGASSMWPRPGSRGVFEIDAVPIGALLPSMWPRPDSRGVG